MTPHERAAYNAGIKAVRQVAMVATVSIKAGADGREVCHCAAAAALHGLAEGARGLILGAEPEPAAAGRADRIAPEVWL